MLRAASESPTKLVALGAYGRSYAGS